MLPPASFVCQFQALLPVSTDILLARGCLFPSTRICALSSPASTPIEPSALRMRLTLSVAAKALLSGSPAATAVHPPLQLQPRGLSGSQRGHCGLWRFSAPSSCSPSLSQPPWALPGPLPTPTVGSGPSPAVVTFHSFGEYGAPPQGGQHPGKGVQDRSPHSCCLQGFPAWWGHTPSVTNASIWVDTEEGHWLHVGV